MPSNKTAAELGKGCENSPDCPATDAQFLAPRPAAGNAATIPRRPHPKKPWERLRLRSTAHSEPEQTRHPRGRRFSQPRHATRARLPLTLHVPPGGILILRIRGKFQVL